MRGILSRKPAPGAVRILLGAHLMLLVEAALVLGSRTVPEGMAAVMLVGFLIGGILALVAAVLREPHAAAHTATPEDRRHV